MVLTETHGVVPSGPGVGGRGGSSPPDPVSNITPFVLVVPAEPDLKVTVTWERRQTWNQNSFSFSPKVQTGSRSWRPTHQNQGSINRPVTCCQLTVSEVQADVVQRHGATVPETPAGADEDHLQNKRTVSSSSGPEPAVLLSSDFINPSIFLF